MDRLFINFKRLIHTSTKKRYLLTLIYEYSRFPIGFTCPDMTTIMVINCFNKLFAIIGMAHYVYSDGGPHFMSEELQSFLHEKE